ncbi:SAM hydrolase/SAM-dependent halogenase family protein [Dissulfurispira sp.]|uniref:SAM hydrolase/SAM-dependent halogenase family protein n=1 Tax=Dissulfurispira sp. TaxID=2817609 RepID=UPI002FDA7341
MRSSEALRHKIITLTTDFGYKDPFVGEMKGVILSINPSVTLVDITHGIEPHKIEECAFIIGSSYKYFPSETIHIAVVDPGVGSERRPIIIEADGYYFVGPDNGIFSYVLSFSSNVKVIHITEERYMLSKDSPTFQGRDVFAPVAAWLSKGIALEAFGCTIDDFKRFEVPLPKVEGDKISGEIIYVDTFGNVITNIRKSDLQGLGEKFSVEIEGKVVRTVKNYSQASDNSLYCLINSSGHLEFFVYMDSASRLFDINKGEKVTVLKQN